MPGSVPHAEQSMIHDGLAAVPIEPHTPELPWAQGATALVGALDEPCWIHALSGTKRLVTVVRPVDDASPVDAGYVDAERLLGSAPFWRSATFCG